VAEALHRTHMGCDQDYKDLLLHGARTSLADGWGGSMIATDLQDVLFGTPAPVASEINLGVLKEDQVNVIIHGHEPYLAEAMAVVAQDPELIEFAKSKGAKGINLAGMCCTANEILMRHGIPIAGNFLQQELAIVTGALDAMVVDVQCIMQGLAEVAGCYHTKLITTDRRAKIQGATHMEFDEHHPMDSARAILRAAIENFRNQRRFQRPDSGCENASDCGLQPRDNKLPAGRPFPGILPSAERKYHQRAHPWRGRGGGLQQRQGFPR